MKTVTISISAEGETTIAVKGVTGPSCLDLTRAIEQAIGRPVSDEPTSDMYRPAVSAGAALGREQQA